MADQWYTRPVLFVSDMSASLHYYVHVLGFTIHWQHEDDGETIVAQVNRGSACEIILCKDAGKAGQARLFVSLLEDELTALLQLTDSGTVPSTRGFWGYPVLILSDPDGNDLYVCLET